MNKKKGQFSPEEDHTIQELVESAGNVTTGLKLAAERLNRELTAVQTRYYKAIRKSNTPKDPPSKGHSSNNRLQSGGHTTSLALESIKALTPNLQRGERIEAVRYIVEMQQ